MKGNHNPTWCLALVCAGAVLLPIVAAHGQQPAGMGDFMKAMGALMSGGTNAAAVVDFRELKALLPAALPGMKRKNASGEKSSAMGMTISTAEGTYASEAGASISIKLTDMGGTGGLMAMAQMGWSAAEIDRESDEGYERTTTIRGHKALEKYNTGSRSGETQVMVAKRFSVEISGRNVSEELLRQAVDAIDLDKLAALKPAEQKN